MHKNKTLNINKCMLCCTYCTWFFCDQVSNQIFNKNVLKTMTILCKAAFLHQTDVEMSQSDLEGVT